MTSTGRNGSAAKVIPDQYPQQELLNERVQDDANPRRRGADDQEGHRQGQGSIGAPALVRRPMSAYAARWNR